MRIVSLLPSLTELVCALGRGADLVGVTHECDFPPGVDRLPHLTSSRIPASATSAEIDANVSAQGGSLYDLDEATLAGLRPTLILTQAQCDVCAVNEGTVRRAAGALPESARVESVNPTDLAGVFAMFRRVGDLLDARAEAERIIDRFHETASEVARRRRGRPVPAVVHLEWFDPPFVSGHWNPELVELAGGREVIGRPGLPSRKATWGEVAAARPEVVLLAPCGFAVERTERELPALQDNPAWQDVPAVKDGRVALIDGSAYFSRPGPRLEASLRIAAAAIDPDSCADLAELPGWRMLTVVV
ncbi:MAG TPA: cobalamin-binding protein [Isosphaeraceae bacterium]|jgi:iron complex transport system substrate-binding protein|nr:cobalamin-binding protein [Isosphaeraceae bacterium]